MDTLTDLTCEEAKKTEDPKLIEQFCPEEGGTESPLEKSVDEVTTTTKKTVKQVEETVKPPPPGDEEPNEPQEPNEPGGNETPDPGAVLPGGGGGEAPTGGDGNNPTGGREVEGAGNEFAPVDEGRNDGRDRRPEGAAGDAAADDFAYNADGPFLPGMQSQSSLTLQPFAAPLVSVPPVYELPQIAQELFGTSTTAAGAEDPLVAGSVAADGTTTSTAASPYSPTGFAATTADPTGWLAATATGLIMLVGAGHALNGGRTPRREKA